MSLPEFQFPPKQEALQMEGNENEIEVECPEEFEPLLPIQKIFYNKTAVIGAALVCGFVFIFLCVESILLHHAQVVNYNLNIQIANPPLRSPVVKTPLGELKGLVLKSDQQRWSYYAFYGVPYAEPPIGNLRFQPPKPSIPWNGIRNATEPGQMCVQEKSGTVVGSEDCLYLNVFTPSLSRPGILPVIVFLHGPSFDSGDANELNVAEFMDEDIVLVAIQYRLGVLGFLNTEDEAAPGNQGIMDQVEALKWVQNNIAAFGGNSSRVTVLGNQSGATAAHALLLSPLTQGLISGVISMSGTALLERVNRNTRSTAIELGISLNYSQAKDSVELVNYLRNVPAETLVRHQSSNFRPFLESASIFQSPLKLLQGCTSSSKIPWLISVSSSEWLSPKYVEDDQRLKYDWFRYAPGLLKFPTENPTQLDEMLEKLRHFYFIENKFNSSNPFLDLISDRFFGYPALASAMLRTQFECSPVYLLFTNKDSMSTNSTRPKQSILISDRLIKVWVSFAKGTPAIPDKIGASKMEPVTQDNHTVKDGWVTWNTAEDAAALTLLKERLRLWDTFPVKLLF